MRARFALPIVLGIVAYAPVALAEPPHKLTGVIERVVAVVDHRAIFLSELRARAKPFLLRIDATQPNDAAKAAAQSQLYTELLDKLIDEKLIAQAAERARTAVTTDQVDLALQNIATAQKLTIPALMQAARDQGLSETDYRDEIRRQLLEGTLLQRRMQVVKSFSSLSEAEKLKRMEAERTTWMNELREKAYIDKRL